MLYRRIRLHAILDIFTDTGYTDNRVLPDHPSTVEVL
jgi:hypothetical protein